MSSASSTDRDRPGRDSGFQPWHFYLLLAMAGATWAVIASRNTHPAALLMISAAVIAAGLVATTLHYAVSGFFGGDEAAKAPVTGRTREYFEREKALVLRSIKELEFDHAMRKVGDRDFEEMSGRLRARAVELMEALEHPGADSRDAKSAPRTAVRSATMEKVPHCPSCGTATDADARFCKHCGAKL
jgi:hypothetical protein